MDGAGLRHAISKLPITARFRPSLAALRKVHKKGVIAHQQSTTLRHSDLVQAGLGSLDAADRYASQPGRASTACAAHSLKVLPLQRTYCRQGWGLAHHGLAWMCKVLPELHAAFNLPMLHVHQAPCLQQPLFHVPTTCASARNLS